MSFAGTHARVHACSTSRARRPLGGGGALRASRVSAPSQRRGRTAAASSDAGSSGSVSASDATKFDALLAELGACPDADFAALVASTREQFTVSFYEHAAGRVRALEDEGDAKRAAALDRLCGRTMAAAETAFGATLTDGSRTGAASLPTPTAGTRGDDPGDGGDDAGSESAGFGLTAADRAELAARRDAVSAFLYEVAPDGPFRNIVSFL